MKKFFSWAYPRTNLGQVPPPGLHYNTLETRIKEPVFIRTSRLKFNVLNPLNKNPAEEETGRRYYKIGFMSSEFLRILKNSWHSEKTSSVVQRRSNF